MSISTQSFRFTLVKLDLNLAYYLYKRPTFTVFLSESLNWDLIVLQRFLYVTAFLLLENIFVV